MVELEDLKLELENMNTATSDVSSEQRCTETETWNECCNRNLKLKKFTCLALLRELAANLSRSHHATQVQELGQVKTASVKIIVRLIDNKYNH